VANLISILLKENRSLAGLAARHNHGGIFNWNQNGGVRPIRHLLKTLAAESWISTIKTMTSTHLKLQYQKQLKGDYFWGGRLTSLFLSVATENAIVQTFWDDDSAEELKVATKPDAVEWRWCPLQYSLHRHGCSAAAAVVVVTSCVEDVRSPATWHITWGVLRAPAIKCSGITPDTRQLHCPSSCCDNRKTKQS